MGKMSDTKMCVGTDTKGKKIAKLRNVENVENARSSKLFMN